jgi:hypothetical protein
MNEVTSTFERSAFGKKLSSSKKYLKNEKESESYDDALAQFYSAIERHDGRPEFRNDEDLNNIFSNMNISKNIENVIRTTLKKNEDVWGSGYNARQKAVSRKNRMMKSFEENAQSSGLYQIDDGTDYDTYVSQKGSKPTSGATVTGGAKASSIGMSVPSLLQGIQDTLNRGIYVQIKKDISGTGSPSSRKSRKIRAAKKAAASTSSQDSLDIIDEQTIDQIESMMDADASADVALQDTNGGSGLASGAAKKIRLFSGVMAGIMAGNSDKAWDQLMSNMSEKFRNFGNYLSENFFTPIKKTLFGTKDENGYIKDGMFSAINNRMKESFYSMRRLINGKGYRTADGDIVPEASKEEMKNTVVGKLTGVFTTVREAISAKLFGEDEVLNEKGEVEVKAKRGLIGKFADSLQGSAGSLMLGLHGWKVALFGEKGEEVDPKEAAKQSREKFEKALPGGIVGAIGGAGAAHLVGSALLPNLALGPVGALIGFTTGMVAKGDKFQKFLFGEDDGSGNKINGLISDSTQKFFKDNGKYVLGGAILGGLKGALGSGPLVAGLLPGAGAPILLGSIMGMATSIVIRSKGFEKFLYGDEKEGQLGLIKTVKNMFTGFGKKSGTDDPDSKKLLGMSIIGAGAGALTGLAITKVGILGAALGPAGPIGGAILGLGASILAQKSNFREWLFGKTDSETGVKREGLLGKLKNSMMVNVVTPIKNTTMAITADMRTFFQYEVLNNFNLILERVGNGLFGWMSKVGHGLKDKASAAMDYIREDFMTGVIDGAKTIFAPLAEAVSLSAKGIANVSKMLIKAPLNLIKAITSPVTATIAKVAGGVVAGVGDVLKFGLVKPIEHFVIKPAGVLLKGTFKVIQAPFVLLGKVTNAIADKVNHITQFFAQISHDFKAIVTAPFKAFGKQVKNFGARIKETALIAISPITDFVKSAITEVKDTIKRGFSKVFHALNPITWIKGIGNLFRKATGRDTKNDDGEGSGPFAYIKRVWKQTGEAGYTADHSDSFDEHGNSMASWKERNKWNKQNARASYAENRKANKERRDRAFNQKLIEKMTDHQRYQDTEENRELAIAAARKSGKNIKFKDVAAVKTPQMIIQEKGVNAEVETSDNVKEMTKTTSRILDLLQAKLSGDGTRVNELVTKYKKEDDDLAASKLAAQEEKARLESLTPEGRRAEKERLKEEARVKREEEKVRRREEREHTKQQKINVSTVLDNKLNFLQTGRSGSDFTDEAVESTLGKEIEILRRRGQNLGENVYNINSYDNSFDGNKNTQASYVRRHIFESNIKKYGMKKGLEMNKRLLAEEKAARVQGHSNGRVNLQQKANDVVNAQANKMAKDDSKFAEYLRGEHSGLSADHKFTNFKVASFYQKYLEEKANKPKEIPKNEKGTGYAKRGPAIVGENGVEAVYSKNSKFGRLVGVGGPEVVNMQGGEVVIPNSRIERFEDGTDKDDKFDRSDLSDKDLSKSTNEKKLSIGERMIKSLNELKTTMSDKMGVLNSGFMDGFNNFDEDDETDYDTTNIDRIKNGIKGFGRRALRMIPGYGLVRGATHLVGAGIDGGRTLVGAGREAAAIGYDKLKRGVGKAKAGLSAVSATATDKFNKIKGFFNKDDDVEDTEDAEAQAEVSSLTGENRRAEQAMSADKLVDEEREERKLAALQQIEKGQKEHNSAWDFIFSKKGLITGGLLLAAPLIFKLLNSNFVKGIIGGIGNIASWIWDKFEDKIDIFKNWIGNFWGDIKFGIQNLGNFLNPVDKIQQLGERLGAAIEDLSSGHPIDAAKDLIFDKYGQETNYSGAMGKYIIKKGARGVAQTASIGSQGIKGVGKYVGTKILGTKKMNRNLANKNTQAGASLFSSYGKNTFKDSKNAWINAGKNAAKNSVDDVAGVVVKNSVDDVAGAVVKNAVTEGTEAVLKETAEQTSKGMLSKVIEMVKGFFNKITGKVAKSTTDDAAKVSSKLLPKITQCLEKHFGKIGARIGAVLGMTAALVSTGIGYLAKTATWVTLGAINGATGAKRLFRTDTVDALMVTISTAIGAFNGTTVGSICDIVNELIVSVLGFDMYCELATLLYSLIAGKDAAAKLREGQEQFQQEYDDYKNAQVYDQYNTAIKAGILDKSVTQEQYKAGLEDGTYAASVESFADYNDEQHKTLGAKIGDGFKSVGKGIKKGWQGLFGSTEEYKVDQSTGNRYKDNGDGSYSVYDSDGNLIGDKIAEGMLPKNLNTETIKKKGKVGQLLSDAADGYKIIGHKIGKLGNKIGNGLKNVGSKIWGNVKSVTSGAKKFLFGGEDTVWRATDGSYYKMLTPNAYACYSANGDLIGERFPKDEIEAMIKSGELVKDTIPVKSLGGRTFDSINKTLTKTWTTVKDKFSGVVDGVKNKASKIWGGITSKVAGAVSGVKNFLFSHTEKRWHSTEGGYYQSNGGSFDYYNENGDLISEGISADEFEELAKAGIVTADDAEEVTVNASIKNIFSNIGSKVKGVFTTLGEKASGAWSAIKSGVGSIFDKVTNNGLTKWIGGIFKGETKEVWYDTDGNYYKLEGSKYAKYNVNGDVLEKDIDPDKVEKMSSAGLLTRGEIIEDGAAKKAINKIKDAVKDAWDAAKNKVVSGWDSFVDWLGGSGDGPVADAAHQKRVQLTGGGFGIGKNLGYPVIKGGRGEDNDAPLTINGSAYYSQNDSRWSNSKYVMSDGTDDGATMGDTGCGPTAMAMALTDMNNKNITPIEMARFAQFSGARDESGTNWTFIDNAANAYGYDSIRDVHPSAEAIKAEVSSGNPVVLLGADDGGGSSPYTKAGHYIVAVGTQGDNIVFNDPRGTGYSGSINAKDLSKYTASSWQFGKKGKSGKGGFGSRVKNLYRNIRGGRGTALHTGGSADTSAWMSVVRTVKAVMASTSVANGVDYQDPMYMNITIDRKTLKVRTDCSGYVEACLRYYGALEENFTSGIPLTSATSTGMLSSDCALMKQTGFSFSNFKSWDRLSQGDILVKNGHTVIFSHNADDKHYVYNCGGDTPLHNPTYETCSDSFTKVWSPNPSSNLLIDDFTIIDPQSSGGSSTILSRLGNVFTSIGTDLFDSVFTGDFSKFSDWQSYFSSLKAKEISQVDGSTYGLDPEGDAAAFSDTDNNGAKIWHELRQHYTEEQTAGIMGNMYQESRLLPNNLEQKGNTALGMTDEEYTNAVDTGKYTNFANDTHGYGLVQWTYGHYKRGLMDWAKSHNNKSIGNLYMQLGYLYDQLTNGSSQAAGAMLKSSTSISDATDAFLTGFEMPQLKSNPALKDRYKWELDTRTKNAANILAKYKGTDGMTGEDNTAVTTLGGVAGYLNGGITDEQASKLDAIMGISKKSISSLGKYKGGSALYNSLQTNNKTAFDVASVLDNKFGFTYAGDSMLQYYKYRDWCINTKHMEPGSQVSPGYINWCKDNGLKVPLPYYGGTSISAPSSTFVAGDPNARKGGKGEGVSSSRRTVSPKVSSPRYGTHYTSSYMSSSNGGRGTSSSYSTTPMRTSITTDAGTPSSKVTKVTNNYTNNSGNLESLMREVVTILGNISGSTDNLSLLRDIKSGINNTSNVIVNTGSGTGSSSTRKTTSSKNGSSGNVSGTVTVSEKTARKIAFGQ